MTDRKTVSAVLAVVLLVVTTGTAVALTSSGVAQQDGQNETPDNVTADTVSLDNATLENSTVNIDTVNIDSLSDANLTLFGNVGTLNVGEASDTTVVLRDGVQAGESFDVSALQAPANATVGDTITVSADVTNPNNFTSTQNVEFRLEGDVVTRRAVTIDAGATQTVSFEIDTSGIAPGTYSHGVFTHDFGEVADITLTEMAPPAEENATVTFENQTSDGTTVTVQEVFLPDGGFVVIHDASLLDGDAVGSTIGHSAFLEAGTHTNVSVTLNQPIDETQTLIAMAHMDNGNQTFDFVSSNGAEDGPYTVDGDAVIDDAVVTVEGEEVGSITFENQSLPRTVVTIDSVTMPGAGFVVLEDDQGRVVGISSPLEADTTENVQIAIIDSLDQTQDQIRLTARLHQDQNDDGRFDAETDPPFMRGGQPIADEAIVQFE